MHKKSELSSITLNNLRHIYFFNEKGISEKIMTEDQFLDYTLLFKSFFISHSQYNDLLVRLDSKETVNKFKGKQVDLYNIIMVFNVLVVNQIKQHVCMVE